MGCFLACFGGAKDPKRRHRPKRSPPIHRVNQTYCPLLTSPSPRRPIKQLAQLALPHASGQTQEEQGSFPSCRKKVTFDLNVKTYESVLNEDDEDEASTDPAENGEGKLQGSPVGGAYPLNHRYQYCESSSDDDDDNEGDDDVEGLNDDDDDCEEEEDEIVGMVCPEEESYDSFFSLPVDKEKKQESCVEEVDSPIPTSLATKGSARDLSQYVHSVLNPVENLSQWKVRAMPLKNPDKENNDFGTETLKTPNKENIFEPIFDVNNKKPQKPSKEEISVDASLSTWLVSSESLLKEEEPQRSNSNWSNSTVSREEQPILGALTLADLKHSPSVTSSPRRSPIRNPDEMPILGTVGSYWNSTTQNSDAKGIPNTTSKYREDKRVNWHSTPFEVRLERALNKGAAEACLI